MWNASSALTHLSSHPCDQVEIIIPIFYGRNWNRKVFKNKNKETCQGHTNYGMAHSTLWTVAGCFTSLIGWIPCNAVYNLRNCDCFLSSWPYLPSVGISGGQQRHTQLRWCSASWATSQPRMITILAMANYQSKSQKVLHPNLLKLQGHESQLILSSFHQLSFRAHLSLYFLKPPLHSIWNLNMNRETVALGSEQEMKLRIHDVPDTLGLKHWLLDRTLSKDTI